MEPRTYRVIIERVPDESGGGFFARVPALPGCFTEGRTTDEIVSNLRDVVPMWVKMLEEDGLQVPPSDISDPASVKPIHTHLSAGGQTGHEDFQFQAAVAV